MMDTETKLVLEWLAKLLPGLRASGDNWQIVLHGGRGGDVLREVKTTGTLLPVRKKEPTEAQHRS